MEIIYTRKELADVLACSEADLANWARLPESHDGRLLPSVKKEGRTFYRRQEVVAWLERNPHRLAIAVAAKEEREAFQQQPADPFMVAPVGLVGIGVICEGIEQASC